MPDLGAFREVQAKTPEPQTQTTTAAQAGVPGAKGKINPAKPVVEASAAPVSTNLAAATPNPLVAPEIAIAPPLLAQTAAISGAKDTVASPAASPKATGSQAAASAKHAPGAPVGTSSDPKSEPAEASAATAVEPDGLGSAANSHPNGAGLPQGAIGSDTLPSSFAKAMATELPSSASIFRDSAGTTSAALTKGEAAFQTMQPTGAAHALGGDPPQTLVATQNVLEVGITGGAHGWLRIRAELGQTGEVTASLVASNAGAADMLHKQLGALSAFLKSESVGVSSLAVTAPEKSGASASATYGNAASAGGGTNPGSQGRGHQDAARTLPQIAPGEAAPAEEGFNVWPINLAATASLAQGLRGTLTGGWLNVMA